MSLNSFFLGSLLFSIVFLLFVDTVFIFFVFFGSYVCYVYFIKRECLWSSINDHLIIRITASSAWIGFTRATGRQRVIKVLARWLCG